MSDFYRELKELVEESVEEISGATDQLKNDLINAFKEDENLGPVGDALEKVDKALTTIKNPKNAFIDSFRLSDDELSVGDHIKVARIAYTHHGIYIGDNHVIHYSDGEIKESTLDEFKLGGSVIKVLSGKVYDDEEIVNRAYMRMYENDYNLVFNNCEHFARWCRSGD